MPYSIVMNNAAQTKAVNTYSINTSSEPEGRGATCHVYRDCGAGPQLVTFKRGRDQADATREALADVRRCRRGGMLVSRERVAQYMRTRPLYQAV